MITLGSALTVSDMSAPAVSDKNLVEGSEKCESAEMLPRGSTPVSPKERRHIFNMPVLPLGY